MNAAYLEELAVVGLDVVGVSDHPSQLHVAATKRR